MCFTFILLVTITLVPCQILTKKNKYKMNYNSRAVGCKNGEPGVLPSGVEAKPAPTFLRGHFLKLLSIFYCFFIGLRGLSAEVRFGIGAFCFKTKDTNNFCQRQRPNFHQITNSLVLSGTHQAFMISSRS
jgi:hypothetical protein